MQLDGSDYSHLERAYAAVTDALDEVHDVRRSVNGVIEATAWQSPTAQKYRAELDQWRADLSRAAWRLEDVRNAVRIRRDIAAGEIPAAL